MRGRVQGVGFRWFVREAARRLDVAGWVRNRPDGSVEVEAEGTEAAIQSLRGALDARARRRRRRPRLMIWRSTGELLARPFTILR